jgi:hypothetical protein
VVDGKLSIPEVMISNCPYVCNLNVYLNMGTRHFKQYAGISWLMSRGVPALSRLLEYGYQNSWTHVYPDDIKFTFRLTTTCSILIS